MVTTPDWTSDRLDSSRTEPWDLVVVGGGTAGIVAAKTAARMGADVVLVERARPGGDCLWTGCVPSKALLATAHHEGSSADFTQAMARVHGAIATIEPADAPEGMRELGVTVLHGQARFTGPRSLTVDGQHLPFRRAVIATGSEPVMPPIKGLDGPRVITSDTVWSLTEQPASMLVVGGGAIGCELGQAFARLGTQVTLVEAGPRLVPNEDEDAAALLLAALRADRIDVRTGVSLEEVTGSTARLADGTGVGADRILVAVGRRPRTHDLGLAEAGIQLTGRGHVVVNRRLRTSNRRVWAAGDVTGHPQFTHVAGVHASVAASNAVLGLRRSAEVSTMPHVTYTQPEIASFGAGLRQVGDSGLRQRTITHDDVDRAITDGRPEGLSRLVMDRRGRIVGATLVGPRAGESLAEVVLAARHGLRARDLAAATHAYPTYGDGVWNAALAELQDQLAQPRTQRVIRVLLRLRRRLTR